MADPVLEAMDRLSAPFQQLERQQQQLLLESYRTGYANVSAQLEALQARVATAPKVQMISPVRNETFFGVPPSWTFQEKRYVQLQDELRSLVGDMENALGTATSRARQTAFQAGIDSATQIGTRAGDVPISSWAKVPTGAFQAWTGSASSGPVAALLESFGTVNGPLAAGYARDVIGAGLLRGQAARTIAVNLQEGIRSLTYSRALRIARTETIRAYREGQRQSYVANRNVVQSWQWRAAVENQERPPCAACFAKHGSLHPIEEQMNSHPNCRCRMIPRRSPVLGVSPNDPVLLDAKAAFDRLAPAQQRRILGPSRLQLYQSGRVRLSDFATSRARGPWGVNDATVRPLRELRTLSQQPGRALQHTSERLFGQAAAAEPEVSAVLQRLGTQTGASLEGFAFRLKRPDRIAEKIRADVIDGKGLTVRAGEHINDALRYTYRLNPKTYGADVESITNGLLRQGYSFVKPPKNYWQAPSGYRGYHQLWRTPSGARFELQYHTRQSLLVKEESHKLYEIQRLLTTSPAERARLQQQIDELWAGVRTPTGAKRIPDEWAVPTRTAVRTFATEEEAYAYYDDFARGSLPTRGESIEGSDWWNLREYTGGGFRHVNGLLRKGDDALQQYAEGEAFSFSEVKKVFTETKAAAERMIATIERSMVALEDAVVVHRGLRSSSPFGRLLVQDETIPLAERLAKLPQLVGQSFDEAGFLSTTVRDLGVTTFARTNVQFHITVPAGTRATWMRPISHYEEEAELLLDRGLRLVIQGVRQELGDYGRPDIWHVDLTVVPKL